MIEACEQQDLCETTTDAGRGLRVAPVASLESLSGEWNSLAPDRPFSRYEWLAPWWRRLGTNQRLFTLGVWNESDELVAIAPWRIERLPIGGRVVRFLGSGAACSDYATLLCRDEGGAAPAAIARWLTGPARHCWDLLELTGVAADEPSVERLVAALGALGHRVHARPDQSCWRVELPGNWEQFLGGLSASRRQRTRTLWRRAFANSRARIVNVTNVAELEQCFGILVDLHTRRRRSLGQPGCFADPDMAAFLREAAEGMLAAGRLRMFWLELEGRPIAVEFGFSGGDVVHYYQGGFDPDAAAERPGWLCFAASLRMAIDQGYRSFDFLRGDEAYKASWGATARPMIEYRVSARRSVAQLRLSLWRAGVEIKRLARERLRAWIPRDRAGGRPSAWRTREDEAGGAELPPPPRLRTS